MADKERAKKIAAAKKKLKAYKSGDKRGNDNVGNDNVENKIKEMPALQNYFNSSKDTTIDLFFEQEKQEDEQEVFKEEANSETQKLIQDQQQEIETQNNEINLKSLQNNDFQSPIINCSVKVDDGCNDQNNINNSSDLLKTIEVLITEKAHLSKESSKLQISCKEKDYELEEIKTRLKGSKMRIEELEQFYFSEQKKNIGTTERLQSLESDLNKYKRQSEEFSEHIDELKRELSLNKTRISEMENEIKEKSSQLDLNNIRFNQISDENNITIDNRIEVLTQTKFMYEQQIVDLQNMVQQLRAEKDQANQQYQNYVQHLNKDMGILSAKNSELTNENIKLGKREGELIEHISTLEKEIQQNITKTESLRQNMKNIAPTNEDALIQDNKFKLQIEELKKSEEELKKVIEENSKELVNKEKIIEKKSEEIILLNERISNLESERPNDAKLLASIESDKVAASRAMTQNNELRKQLDELQLKLIELTNDKVDLTTLLDSERFTYKQTRQSFDEMQSQIKILSEQLHFKDEEMIRLSHENNELDDKIIELQKLNEQIQTQKKIINSEISGNEIQELSQKENLIDVESHKEGNSDSICNDTDLNYSKVDEKEKQGKFNSISTENGVKRKDSDNLLIPSSEAMWRLEERFKKLIGEVADLTDEKQQLEHLVLQLQGETETIGEYIALYQSQRKILKQKEYERDAQLNRLIGEREDLRNKALQLEALINQIGLKSSDVINSSLTELLNKQKIEMNSSIAEHENNLINGHYENKLINQTHVTELNHTNNIENLNDNKNQNNYNNNNSNISNNSSNYNSSNDNKSYKHSIGHITESDSQKIIDRIQSLVSDLKDNKDTLPLISTSVDHCACCSGKFETI